MTMTNHKTDGLSAAQKNFILKRMHGGDALTESREKDYVEGHNRALASRLKVGSPRYFNSIADHLDGPRKQPEQPARREQPAQPKPRYDGASVPMPKLRGGGDQFHALRQKAASANGRYGKK
jgi:hypothetical protein